MRRAETDNTAAAAERAAYKANIAAMREADLWLDRAHTVIRRTMEMLAAAVNSETGMRGYLLAGKDDGKKTGIFAALATMMKI